MPVSHDINFLDYYLTRLETAGLDPGNNPNYGWNAFQAAGNPGGNWRTWAAQKALDESGMTPDQVMDPFTNKGQGPLKYDPATQKVTTTSYDDQFDFGNVLLAAGAAGVGALSGGFGLGSLFNGAGGATGGADAAWGVNPQGASMDLGDWQDWGSFGDAGGGSLSPVSATNLQDYITKLDSTPTGKAYLEQLIGNNAASDVVGSGSWLNKLINNPTGLASAGSSIFGGGSGSDWSKLLASLGAAGLGAYGANKQADSLNSLAQKYSDYGAPSRARFEASMTPGFDPMSIPGYSGALDTASKGILARLSAQGGNPFGNPGGLIDANKQIVAGTAMPAINEYQRQNANAGFGASMNAAIPLQTAAIGQEGNVLNALGYGLNAVANPQPTLADMIKGLQGYDLKYSV